MKSLTIAQTNASNELQSNVQIIACAGSGKTSTMVQRIINILKQPHIEPKNIVAFTFTEKAASELKERTYNEAQKQIGNTTGLAELYIGTIHGYCLNLLQENDSRYLKYHVLNEIQTKLFVDKTYMENGLLEIQYRDQKGRVSTLQRFKDSGTYIELINTVREENILGDNRYIPENIKRAVQMYEEALHKSFYFDYTSIILEALKLLKNNENIKNKIKNELKFLIVDEYQDVNPIQEELIKEIYKLGTNVCVVGDDDQILYHWRGSKPEIITGFSERYEDVKKFELLENFRSSKGIVDSANFLISNNKHRIEKAMESANNQLYEPYDIIGYQFESEKEEIDAIIEKIKQIKGISFKDSPESEERGLSYSDMAILVYSVKKIPSYLIQRLEQEEIDFVVEGMKNLFEAPEVKASVNIFKFLAGEYTLKDLQEDWANLNLNIDKDDLDKAITNLEKTVPTEDTPWDEFILQEVFANFLTNIGLFDISGYRVEKILYNLAKFTEVINDYEFIHLKTSPINRINGFYNFLKFAASDYYPEGWLSPAYKSTKGLKIMTFFQAKGLEFPVVFMPFLTKSFMFPPRKKGGKNKWMILQDFMDREAYESGTEDLRRLFYVGVTRSKKFLIMTQSPHLFSNGKGYREPAESFREILHSDYVIQDISYDFSDRPKAEIVEKHERNPIVFDFTTLRGYFECPNKFKYSSIYGFIQALDHRMGYGKSIHNMLEDLHRNYRALDKPIPVIVDELIRKHFYLPYAGPKLKESMEKRARQDLERYITLNSDKFYQIIYVEKQIEISLGDNIFVNGRIDLVRNTETNTTTIVDFKSEKKVQSDELIKDQLAIYALGYKKLTGEMPDFIESYTLGDNFPKRIKVTEELLTSIEDKIKSVAISIERNEFEKIKNFGKENPTCSKCAYKDSCLKSKNKV